MSVVSDQIENLPMAPMALNPLVAGSQGSLYVQNLRYQANRWGSRGGFGLLQAHTSLPWGQSGQLTITGVTSFTNDAGHEYLLALGYQSVNTSQVITTPSGSVAPRENQNGLVWVVNLYDLTEGSFQQTILTRRAQQDARPLYQVLPNRSAGGFELNPSNVTATMTWSQDGYAPLSVRNPTAGPTSFAASGDRILLCQPDVGLWLIEPGLTSGDHAGIDSLSGRDCQTGFGESAWCRPLVIRPGVFDGRDYVTQDEIGKPDLVATWQGRTLLVKGRALYFSDAGDPAAYAEINITTIGADQPIRAALPVRNGVLVLTASEVFLYIPSDGDPVSGGSTTLLSTSTGIVPSGPQAATSVNEAACWVSSRGVHLYGGGAEIQTLMGPVANLFAATASTGPVPNPLTNYPVLSGTAPTDTATNQGSPVQTLDLTNVYLSWEPRTQELYLSTPNSNRVLVHAFAEPSSDTPTSAWWTFETQVTTTPAPTVATTTTLAGMRVLGAPTSGGTLTYGIDANGHVYVLGRGGALDASSHPSEDHDEGNASMSWRQETAVAPPSTANIAAFYFGPAYRLPTGFKTNTQTTNQDVWEARLYAQVPDEVLTGDLINRLEVYFTLTSNWRLLCEPGTAELDLTFGPTFQTIYDGFTQLQATNLGGIPDPNGIQGRIVWNTPGPATWATHPDPGLNPHAMYEVCRIRLRRNNLSLIDTTPVSTYINQVPVAEIATDAPTVYTARVYYGAALDRRGSQAYGHDARQKPVDWAYHTPIVGDGNTTMKLRGLWVKARRSGQAIASLSLQWPYGPYNWLYAANDRDLSAREYENPDLPGIPAGIGTGQVTGILPSIPNVLTGGVAEQVWGGTSTCWGPSGPAVPPPPTGATQVPLVGTTPVSQWACTSGGRGESARWLLFGYLRGRAEYIQFAEANTLSVITRPQAPRKRRGGQ